MKMTNRGLYALKAMMTLATSASREKPLALHRIAEEQDISAEFLQQIFFRLRKSDLISAYRGPGGGFFLAKPSGEISVLEVLEAAGESLELTPCSSPKKNAPSTCQNCDNCKAGEFWTELEGGMRDFASSRTLADLTAK